MLALSTYITTAAPVTITATSLSVSIQPASSFTTVITATLPQATLTSLSIQPQATVTTLSVQPQATVTTLSVQPQETVTTLSVQPQATVTTLSVQPQATVTVRSDKIPHRTVDLEASGWSAAS